ncbi:hypothetical protein HPB51_024900 [Rhipicephalus microplus]|uniref:PPPDE domain-containing protein n=1 Tax=Rhipicephalus microplus TaxID=6941 RepID=A0A9J6EPL2_RHIMP|nr:hypothetical protein HPB51_024900 [Rhipicephalus microplus]
MASPSCGRAESASEVLLYVYDLSNGMVKALSPALIGKELSGLWHTGIVLRGTEYYFGCLGVDKLPGGEDRPRGSAPDRQPRSHRATSRRLRGVYPRPGQVQLQAQLV